MADKHYVVVDGSNLATEGRKLPSLAQLDEAVRAYADEDPDAEIVVVVDASFEHRIDPSEAAQLEQAELHGEVVSPPAGAIGRGDAFVLRIAERTGASVLSNDSFQEFHGEHAWLFDEGRLIGGKPVPGIGWIFTPRSPVRGPKSRQATSKAKSKTKHGGADVTMAPAEKAAELAKAARKIDQVRRPPERNGDGSTPRIGDVWVPSAPARAAEAPPAIAAPAPAATPTGRVKKVARKPAEATAGSKPGKKPKERAPEAERTDEPTAAKKATAKKATAKKAPAKKAPAKKAPAKQATAKQATAKQATAKQATAKKATAKKATAKKAAEPKATDKKANKKVAATKPAVTKAAASKAADKKAADKKAADKKAVVAAVASAKTAEAKKATAAAAKVNSAKKATAPAKAAAKARAATAGAVPTGAAKTTAAKSAGTSASPKQATKAVTTATQGSSTTRATAASAARSGAAVAAVAETPGRRSRRGKAVGDAAGQVAADPVLGAAVVANPQLRAAIVEATAEAVTPPPVPSRQKSPPAEGGKGGSKKGKRRRRTNVPPPAVNEPLAFINFVAAYPVGSTVEGEVASFTSHGAMVEVAVPDGSSLHCYIPLSGLGIPAPSKARDVVSRGERLDFVLVGLDPPRRVAELALPSVLAASVAAG
jgi:hypothetical protein